MLSALKNPAWALLLPLLLQTTLSGAELRLADVFSDHMVLQREKPVPIWGTAPAGTPVTVAFADQEASTTTDKQGRWRLDLEPLTASSQSRSLVVRGADATVTLTDVLVGEVWIGGGQSNMCLPVRGYVDEYDPNQKQDLRLLAMSEQSYPLIRYLGRGGGWRAATDARTNQGMSGLLFPFLVFLHQKLNVPVGGLCHAQNSSSAGVWVTNEMIAAHAPEQWARITAQAQERGRKLKMGGSYSRRGGIGSWAPYAARGVLWDQGEGGGGGGLSWDEIMPCLVAGWRTDFEQPFPFIYIQKPSGGGCAWNPDDPVNEGALPFGAELPGPDIRKKMQWSFYRLTFTALESQPDVFMVPSQDLVGLIHPINKWGYAKRTLRIVMSSVYGQDPQGGEVPRYRTHRIEGNQVHVTFERCGPGLAYRHGEQLQGFAIAGADRRWHWADAQITADDTVTLSSPAVPTPVAVRYALDRKGIKTRNIAWANLFSKNGLPALSFRTDDWER